MLNRALANKRGRKTDPVQVLMATYFAAEICDQHWHISSAIWCRICVKCSSVIAGQWIHASLSRCPEMPWKVIALGKPLHRYRFFHWLPVYTAEIKEISSKKSLSLTSFLGVRRLWYRCCQVRTDTKSSSWISHSAAQNWSHSFPNNTLCLSIATNLKLTSRFRFAFLCVFVSHKFGQNLLSGR